MEAVVNIKVSPRELALIVASVKLSRDFDEDIARDGFVEQQTILDPRLRRKAKEELAEYQNILAKLT